MLNIHKYVHKSIKVFGILQYLVSLYQSHLQFFSFLCFTNNISRHF